MTGEVFALLTALLWSGSAIVFSTVTGRISSVQTNIIRLVLAEIYLALFLVFIHVPLALSVSQVLLLLGSGIIGLALGDSFLFRAYQEVGARVSMLLMALAPAIGAAVAALMLGEHLGAMAVAGMAITICGIALVIIERGADGGARLNVTFRGVILGLLAATGQGVGLVFAKAAFRESPVDGFLATSVRIIGGLLLLIPAAVATGRWGNPARELRKRPSTAALLALGAVLGPFLGIACSLISVARTSVGVASTIMATVPVVMLPLNRVVNNERLPLKALLGACIAVAGVAVLFIE